MATLPFRKQPSAEKRSHPELNAPHGSASGGFVRPPVGPSVHLSVRTSTSLATSPQSRPTENDTNHTHARARPLARATSPCRAQQKHTSEHTPRPFTEKQLAPPHPPVPERCMQSHQAFPRINLGKRYSQVVPSQARRRRTRGIARLRSDAALPQPTGATPGSWATHPR